MVPDYEVPVPTKPVVSDYEVPVSKVKADSILLPTLNTDFVWPKKQSLAQRVIQKFTKPDSMVNLKMSDKDNLSLAKDAPKVNQFSE